MLLTGDLDTGEMLDLGGYRFQFELACAYSYVCLAQESLDGKKERLKIHLEGVMDCNESRYKGENISGYCLAGPCWFSTMDSHGLFYHVV